MIDQIRRFFATHIGVDALADDPDRREHAHRLATAALLIEISRADYDVKEVERATVADAVRRAFDLRPEETAALIELAEHEVEHATSLFEFTRLVNETFDEAEKCHVVELLWRVAIADGHVDKYEEHLVRRIADLLHVPHREFVKAKHRAGAHDAAT